MALCRPVSRAYLAPGRPTNFRGAPRPTPGGLVRGPAYHAAQVPLQGGTWRALEAAALKPKRQWNTGAHAHVCKTSTCNDLSLADMANRLWTGFAVTRSRTLTIPLNGINAGGQDRSISTMPRGVGHRVSCLPQPPHHLHNATWRRPSCFVSPPASTPTEQSHLVG